MLASQVPNRALGIITPSGNVVVEWTAIELMRSFPDVGLNFARIPVSGCVDPHPQSYDWRAMTSAAGLLSDARPGALVWAGSKGVLVGPERENELRQRIEGDTGLAFTSSTLALGDLRDRTGMRRIALVTPYGDAYQRRLIEGFARIGLECVCERHAGIDDNLSYAHVRADDIRRMAREVVAEAKGGLDAILAWCTNLPAGPLATGIETETGIPFYDATTLALGEALRGLSVDLKPAHAWGRLFQN